MGWTTEDDKRADAAERRSLKRYLNHEVPEVARSMKDRLAERVVSFETKPPPRDYWTRDPVKPEASPMRFFRKDQEQDRDR